MNRFRRHMRAAEFYPYSSLRDMNHFKSTATRAVANAVRTGALIPQPCTECGAKAEAHHEDYTKPLDVRWLCPHHHRLRHIDMRNETPAQVEAVDAPLAMKPPRSRLLCAASLALVRQATEDLYLAMDAAGVSEAEMARRLGVKSANIYLQFSVGFRTLKMLTAYADAIGYDVSVVLSKRHVQSEVAS